MNRRIFFSIVFLLNILFGIWCIFGADNLVEEKINEIPESILSSYDEESMELSIDDLKMSFYITIAFQVLLSLFGIIYTNKSNILKRKLFFIIILFIFALNLSDFNLILCIIDIVSAFVLIMMERKTEDDYPVKRKLPELEVFQHSKREKIIMAIFAGIYFLVFLLPLDFMKDSLSKNALIWTEIGIYSAFTICVIVIFRKKLLRDFKDITKNFLNYFIPALKILLLVLIVNFIASYIIHFIFYVPLPKNEEEIEKMGTLFILFGACIYAPIVEENIFRNILHVFVKNKKVFIILSSIIFGLLHTYDEGSLPLALVQAIPYSILGFFFAYNYAKTNNIAHTMLWHFTWNFIATIMTILFKIYIV
ncbi:MAG: CPBP family intramembrane metalloprotease [Clostridia bacterium]|nr:CPBP family intramembrane metalloprotease [Clostridia bacterium]